MHGLKPGDLASTVVKALILGREYPANIDYHLSAPLVFNQANKHLEPDKNILSAHYLIEGIPVSESEIIVVHKGKEYSKKIEIKSGTEAQISFDFTPAKFTISGKVTQHGNPVAGYLLTFCPADEQSSSSIKGFTTDSEGKYQMELDSGAYIIQINARSIVEIQGIKVEGFGSIYSTSFDLVKNDTLDFEIDKVILKESKENEK